MNVLLGVGHWRLPISLLPVVGWYIGGQNVTFPTICTVLKYWRYRNLWFLFSKKHRNACVECTTRKNGWQGKIYGGDTCVFLFFTFHRTVGESLPDLSFPSLGIVYCKRDDRFPFAESRRRTFGCEWTFIIAGFNKLSLFMKKTYYSPACQWRLWWHSNANNQKFHPILKQRKPIVAL